MRLAARLSACHSLRSRALFGQIVSYLMNNLPSMDKPAYIGRRGNLLKLCVSSSYLRNSIGQDLLWTEVKFNSSSVLSLDDYCSLFEHQQAFTSYAVFRAVIQMIGNSAAVIRPVQGGKRCDPRSGQATLRSLRSDRICRRCRFCLNRQEDQSEAGCGCLAEAP